MPPLEPGLVVANQVTGTRPLADVPPEAAPAPLAVAVHDAALHAPETLKEAMRVAHVELPAAQLPPEQRTEQRVCTELVGACRQLDKAMSGSPTQIPNALETLENLLDAAPARQTEALAGAMQNARDTVNTLPPQARPADGSSGDTPGNGEQIAGAPDTPRASHPDKADRAPDAPPKADDVCQEQVETLEVAPELLDELRHLLGTDGHARPESVTLAEVKADQTRLVALLRRLPTEGSAAGVLRAAVGERLYQVTQTLGSLTRLAAERDNLDELRSHPLAERGVLLRDTAFVALELAQTQTRARAAQNSADFVSRLTADDILLSGNAWQAEEVAALERLVDAEVETFAADTFAADPRLASLTRADMDGLGTLIRKAGIAPDTLLAAVGTALAELPGPQRADMLRAVLAGLNADTPAERLPYVDMLFQGLYPELADEALTLKLAATPPELHDATRLAHAFRLSVGALQAALLEQPSTGGPHGRAATIHAGTGSASARSFLLTPELVSALQAKGRHIEDLNYQLAHVALLQAGAMGAGLLPGAAASSMRDWCASLGLGADASAYAQQVADALEDETQADNALAQLQEASERFCKGLRGERDADRADQLLDAVGGMNRKGKADKAREAIFQGSAAYAANQALYRHLGNLTGFIHADTLLLDPHSGMELDGPAVDRAIRAQLDAIRADCAKLPIELLAGQDAMKTAARVTREKISQLGILKRHRAEYLSNQRVMSTFARDARESVQLQTRLDSMQTTWDRMEKEYGALRFAWPHQRADRDRISRTIVRIGDLNAQLVSRHTLTDGKELTEEQLEGLRAEQTALLESLRGVDVRRLTSHSDKDAPAPRLRDVLEVMLPRARAVLYHQGSTKLDLWTEIHSAHTALDGIEHRLDDMTKRMRKLYGAKPLEVFRSTITAAVLKVFVESGQSADTFRLGDPQVRAATDAQLRDWGLEPSLSLMRPLVTAFSQRLFDRTGMLRREQLTLEAQTPLALQGKSVFDSRAAELRAQEGLSRRKAWKTARAEVEASPELQQARRSEGVRGLMAMAALPGSGFVFDRTRGLILDTGTVFSPFNPDKTKVNLRRRLTAHFDQLHSNSLTVMNTGPTGFQVMLKGRDMFNVAAALNIPLPAGFTAKVSAGTGGESVHGLSLQFAERADREAFLAQFLVPAAPGRPQPRQAWLAAEQVRFIDSAGASAQAGVTLNHSLFSAVLGPLTSGLSASATVTVRGGLTRAMETNALGDTAIFERGLTVTLNAGLSTGITNTNRQRLTPVKPLSTAKTLTLDLTQRFRITQDRHGLGARLELECPRGENMKALLLNLFLPDALSRRIRADQDLGGDLRKLFEEAPDNARVKLNWELRPERQTELHTLAMQARRTEGVGKNRIETRIHQLLADMAAYEPVSITFASASPTVRARERQPALNALKLARSTNLSGLNSVTLALPRLRDGQPETM